MARTPMRGTDAQRWTNGEGKREWVCAGPAVVFWQWLWRANQAFIFVQFFFVFLYISWCKWLSKTNKPEKKARRRILYRFVERKKNTKNEMCVPSFVSFHKNNKKEYKQLHVPRKWYIKIFESASFTESEWKWPLNVTMNRITYGRYTWAHTMHLRLNERKNEVEGRKRDA